jgi:hypothetical protein
VVYAAPERDAHDGTGFRRPREPAKLAARAICSVLVGLPQPACGRPGALRPLNQAAGPALAQADEPLSYRELDDPIVWAGWGLANVERHPRAARFSTSLPTRARAQRQVASGSDRHLRLSVEDDQGRTTVNEPLRPGRGGRIRRVGPRDAWTATQELRDDIGPPVINDRRQGVGIQVWDQGPHLQGAFLTRLSGRDIQNGDTIMGQVTVLRYLLSPLGMQPRYIVLTTDNSGGRRYENRPDFLFIEDAIRNGELAWVAARDTGRVVRLDSARARLYEMLRDTGTAYYLAELSGIVDWANPGHRQLLLLKGITDETEREEIAKRTQTAVFFQRIAQGDGRPGALPFGFYWDKPARQAAIDPEQWQFVKQIHYGYEAEWTTRRYGSLRRLRDALAQQGCVFSVTQIRNILLNPMYHTGEYTVGWNGRRVTTKGVQIPEDERIPLSVLQRNAELLLLKTGPNSAAPVGVYALNRVRLLHARCMHMTVDEGRPRVDGSTRKVQPQLKGRVYGKRDFIPVYAHEPRVPECCSRYTIDQAVIEPVVMRALRELARNPTLQDEWRRVRLAETATATRTLPAAKRKSIEQELAETTAKLERRRAARETKGSLEANLDDEEYLELLRPLLRAEKRLSLQLRADDVLPPKPSLPPTTGVLLDLARSGDLSDKSTVEQLTAALEDILTDEPPTDEDRLRRRAAVVACCLSAIVIHDVDGGFELELLGPLVPPDSETPGPVGPTASARSALEQHLRDNGVELQQRNDRRGPGAPGSDAVDNAEGDRAHRSSRSVNHDHASRTVRDEVDTAAHLLAWEDALPLYFAEGGWRPTSGSHREGEFLVSAPENQGWVPAWRSTRISVETPTGRHLQPLERAIAALRKARTEIPPDRQLSPLTYASYAKGRWDLPCGKKVIAVAREHGMTWPEFRRMALGDDTGSVPAAAERERAAANGRVLEPLGEDYAPLAHYADADLTLRALRAAALRGALAATKRFGVWYAHRDAVEEYRATRYRGPRKATRRA